MPPRTATWVRSSRRAIRAALALIPAFVLFAGCQISVGDQSCTEESNPANKEDACPYGPPGGPKVIESGCPNILLADPDTCTTAPTWAEVYAILNGPTAGCTIGGCHGATPGARGIFLSPTSPDAFYERLKAYTGSQGYPYINEEEPSRSWILCNLKGTPGGGAPMPPPSGLSDLDYSIIEQWAVCGLRRMGGGAVDPPPDPEP